MALALELSKPGLRNSKLCVICIWEYKKFLTLVGVFCFRHASFKFTISLWLYHCKLCNRCFL